MTSILDREVTTVVVMIKALLLSVLLVGCLTSDPRPDSGGDDDVMQPDAPTMPPPPPTPMDASGTWDMTLTWGAGTCGLFLATPAEMIVERVNSGYVVSDAAADTTITGLVLCSVNMCHASFTEVGPGRGDNTLSMTLASDLVATVAGDIIGSGGVTYRFRDGTSCTQQFSASGRLR